MNPDIMMIGQSQESLANHGGPVVEEEDRVSAFSGIEGDDDNNLMMPQLQQPDNLSLSQSSAERAVQEALDHHRLASESLSSGDGKDLSSADSCKRTLEDAELDKAKKLRTEEAGEENVGPATDDIGIIPPGSEGIKLVRDADVLSGRGGGTNVHPGNRHFRDLINLHRRAYLKARKNDKPSISRAIVRAIRENNGRFLKRDEKTGLFFEIGDVNAREKAGQALRQRAPEMRKILFGIRDNLEVRSDAKETDYSTTASADGSRWYGICCTHFCCEPCRLSPHAPSKHGSERQYHYGSALRHEQGCIPHRHAGWCEQHHRLYANAAELDCCSYAGTRRQ